MASAFAKWCNTVFFQGHREAGSGSSVISSTRGIIFLLTEHSSIDVQFLNMIFVMGEPM